MKKTTTGTWTREWGATEATVVGCPSPGMVVVDVTETETAVCSVLDTVPDLGSGDRVLIQAVAGGGAVIVGRIAAREAPTDPEKPDELVIEAGKSLTLKVGDGSITIREDGKILIKGTHLVSHAKKMNRIRGGSVAIN